MIAVVNTHRLWQAAVVTFPTDDHAHCTHTQTHTQTRARQTD